MVTPVFCRPLYHRRPFFRLSFFPSLVCFIFTRQSRKNSNLGRFPHAQSATRTGWPRVTAFSLSSRGALLPSDQTNLPNFIAPSRQTQRVDCGPWTRGRRNNLPSTVTARIGWQGQALQAARGGVIPAFEFDDGAVPSLAPSLSPSSTVDRDAHEHRREPPRWAP